MHLLMKSDGLVIASGCDVVIWLIGENLKKKEKKKVVSLNTNSDRRKICSKYSESSDARPEYLLTDSTALLLATRCCRGNHLPPWNI